jgi:hypothetical protein
MSFLEPHKGREQEPPDLVKALAADHLGVAPAAEPETSAIRTVDKHGVT